MEHTRTIKGSYVSIQDVVKIKAFIQIRQRVSTFWASSFTRGSPPKHPPVTWCSWGEEVAQQSLQQHISLLRTAFRSTEGSWYVMSYSSMHYYNNEIMIIKTHVIIIHSPFSFEPCWAYASLFLCLTFLCQLQVLHTPKNRPNFSSPWTPLRHRLTPTHHLLLSLFPSI